MSNLLFRYLENEHQKLLESGILGAFDPSRFLFGINYQDPMLATNPLSLAVVDCHEREHYYQTISTTIGFLIAHLQQASNLLLLKALVEVLGNNTKAKKFRYPISRWVKYERNTAIKKIVSLAYTKYLSNCRFIGVLGGAILSDGHDPLFHHLHHLDLPRPQKLTSPCASSGHAIGFKCILEGLAQIKSVLALIDYKSYIKTKTEDKNWHKALQMSRKILKQNRRYSTCLTFASDVLKVDLFDDLILDEYAPLLRVAADFALMTPICYESDITWKELHPGWRFRECLLVGKDIARETKSEVAMQEYYENVVKATLEKTEWDSVQDVLKNIISAELSDTLFVNSSYILLCFKEAFQIRRKQPHIFTFSDYYHDSLKKHFPLPVEYIQSSRTPRLKDEIRNIFTYFLPFAIRPSLIEQLFWKSELKCPLSPEMSRFPIDCFQKNPNLKCDYYGFRRRDMNECTFKILLRNIGLEPDGKELLIRNNMV